MTTRIPFTPELHRIMIAEGFSYIYSKGIDLEALKEDSIEHDDYVLVPYRHDFALNFEEGDLKMENIQSTEVKEMLEYTPGIDFWIEADQALVERWRKQIKE